MKRYPYYFILIAALALASSCQKKFLDQVPDDKLTIDQVFQRQDLSEQYLAGVYNSITISWQVLAWDPWECTSDEADVTYNIPSNAKYRSSLMNIGNWSAASDYYDWWVDYYKAIRSASYFMQHIGENRQILALANGKDLIRRYTAEARFCRAYFYFCLLKQYGPVVLLPNDPIPPDAQSDDPELHLPRSPYDSCVAYIARELDLAAKDLPENFTDQNESDYGRATAAACMAVKARMLLYAASPQFNGNQDYVGFNNLDGTPLVNTTYDADKWKKAADAAKAVIDLGIFSLYRENDATGHFSPYLSCRDVSLKPWNSEWIFPCMQDLSYYDRYVSPRLCSGDANVGVTQQMVDAFETKDGIRPITGYKADGSPIIDPLSGYKDTGYTVFKAPGDPQARKTYNMYVDREPRFYVDVAYNGSVWINTTSSLGIRTIGLYYSGESGAKGGTINYSKTGYLWLKNVSPDANPLRSTYQKRPSLMFGYAEILLNYVEALNEYDPGNPDILKYLNLIRERAGVPQYGAGSNPLPAPASQAAMRDAIHHERRIELALEKLRYFDTRRWKIAEKTDGGPFYGMNVMKNLPQFYKRTVFETRVFHKNYYLFPIPQGAIDRDDQMVQNPGW